MAKTSEQFSDNPELDETTATQKHGNDASWNALRNRYPEVEIFSRQMLLELWTNRGKGDQPNWLKAPAEVLMSEIFHHAAKLHAALRAGTENGALKKGAAERYDADLVLELCADVANMAMMLADAQGTLGLVPDAVPESVCSRHT